MTGFAILLTFLAGTADVKEYWVRCPTMACVENLRKHEPDSLALTRLRVFKGNDTDRVELSGKFVSRPIFDDQRS